MRPACKAVLSRHSGASGRHQALFVYHPSASQNKVSAKPVEELTYRRSLRVALDVLNERTRSHQESSSREEGTAVTAGEKRVERAPSLCDSKPSFLPREGVLNSSGPERREQVYQRLSRLSTSKSDLECQVDHKTRIGESESPLALVVSAGGGSPDRSKSRIHLENGTTLSKRGRNWAQEPSGCRNGPSLPVGDGEREREKEAGSPAAQSLPSTVREQGPCAKGRHSGLPSGSPSMHPACPDSRDPPAKQLCSGGSQRSRPRGCMILRSASRSTPLSPSEDTSLHVLEEGRSVPPLGQGGVLVLPQPDLEPGPCFS